MNADDERAGAQAGQTNLFNNFAVWSIRNPIPAILLFFLLCVAGLYGFQQMRIENYPDLDPSFITVSIVQPGASPAQMENEIALRVEDSIATIRGLKHIHTAIRDSVLTMAVEFRLEKSANEAPTKRKTTCAPPSPACAPICPTRCKTRLSTASNFPRARCCFSPSNPTRWTKWRSPGWSTMNCRAH